MRTYRTSEIARIIGIHPNTVRLYEEWGLIPRPERRANGYRVFTDYHVEQFRLARTALRIEVIQSGLRENAVDIVKASAAGRFDEALLMIGIYLEKVEKETQHAEEALRIVGGMLSDSDPVPDHRLLTRKAAAEDLGVTIDTLRNWEMNGLLTVKRRENGYRVYSAEDRKRLKVIRSLRCANYSLAAILRMMNALTRRPDADIRQVIDTPPEEDEIVSACDRLITSLKEADGTAREMRARLEQMKARFS